MCIIVREFFLLSFQCTQDLELSSVENSAYRTPPPASLRGAPVTDYFKEARPNTRDASACGS